MMKPKWKDVPEGYDWIAQYPDGEWWGFGSRPIQEDSIWRRDYPGDDVWANSIMRDNPPNPNWKDTLERRPAMGLLDHSEIYYYRNPKHINDEWYDKKCRILACRYNLCDTFSMSDIEITHEGICPGVQFYDVSSDHLFLSPLAKPRRLTLRLPESGTSLTVRNLIEKMNRDVHNAIMEGSEFTSIPDERACPICLSLDGRMFPLTFGKPYITEEENMNNCPTTKTLNPQERIDAKQERLSDEITALADRVDALDNIKASVNWKNATPEMQNKAVEAADRV